MTITPHSNPRLKVVLADDHAVVRKGIRMLLDLRFNCDVIEVGTPEDAIRACTDPGLHLALLDVRMGDRGGLWALEEIVAMNPRLPVLMLSTFGDPEYVRAAMDGGARGYVLKEATLDELGAAIRTALSGSGLYVHPKVCGALFNPAPVGPEWQEVLSPRERSVLARLASGASNEQIAEVMFLSEKTVKSHLSNIYRKLGVTNRTQAAAMALRDGLTSPDLNLAAAG